MTITYTFAPLQIIFASRFNTNFSDVKSWADAHELINSNIHGITGSFIDTGTANQVSSVPKTFNILSTNSPSFSSNARLSLSGAGVLSLLGANGSAPSVTNPVFFNVPDGTGGWEQISFTSSTNCTIADATSADSYFYDAVNGGLFWGGIESLNGIFPFALYVATDGTTPVVFMARNPCMTTIPTDQTLIGYKNNPPTIEGMALVNPDKQLEVFAWTASNIKASHAGKPCWRIGSIRMQLSSILGDWTIQTLDAGDGIGNDYNFGARIFNRVLPSTGSFFSVTAGTPPTYSNNTVNFKSFLNGDYVYFFNFLNSLGGTAGAGANNLEIYLPARAYSEDVGRRLLGSFYIKNNATTILGNMSITGTASSAAFQYQSTIGTTVSNIRGVDQNNAVREIFGAITYTVFA